MGVSRTDVFSDEAYLKKSRDKLLSVVPEVKDKRVIAYAPTFRGRVAHAEAPTALDIEAMKMCIRDSPSYHSTRMPCEASSKNSSDEPSKAP